MGWTSYNANFYKKGKVDRKAEIDNLWNNDSSKKFKVLKSAMVGSTYYGAIQVEDRVFATIFLTSVDMSSYYNFSYKDMEETCGPFYYDCPISILKLLTDTDNELANQWRQKCWEKHEAKKTERKNPNSLKNLLLGTKISFFAKHETTACSKGDEVVLVKVFGARRKPIWYGHGYRWTERLIKSVSGEEYTIIRTGSGENI